MGKFLFPLIILISLESLADRDSRWEMFLKIEEDKKISCEEITKNPELIVEFRDRLDLGSGLMSPTDIEWDCPALQKIDESSPGLHDVASLINGIDYPDSCSGTFVYAKRRVFYWNLAVMSLLTNETAVFYPLTSKKEAVGSVLLAKRWGEIDRYNNQLAAKFKEAIKLRKEDVYNSFIKNGLTPENARRFTFEYVHLYTSNTFGSLPEVTIDMQDKIREYVENNDWFTIKQVLTRSNAEEVYLTLRSLLLDDQAIVEYLTLLQPNMVEKIEGIGGDLVGIASTNTDNINALLNVGFDPDLENNFGKTALYHAIEHNNYDGVVALVDAGADVNSGYHEPDYHCYQITGWGRSPLHHAVQHGSVKIIQYLINRGANVKHKDAEGKGVIEYAELNDNPDRDDIIDFIKTLI